MAGAFSQLLKLGAGPHWIPAGVKKLENIIKANMSMHVNKALIYSLNKFEFLSMLKRETGFARA